MKYRKFSDLALHNLEMQMIECQKNSVQMATYNEIKAELEIFQHIPKTEQW